MQFFHFRCRLFISNIFHNTFNRFLESISSNKQLPGYYHSIWKKIEHCQIAEMSSLKYKVFEVLNRKK